MYQIENEEIKIKNNVLIDNVRELKEKEDHLL
jgi:FtsZ-binding cell division protein ZapB